MKRSITPLFVALSAVLTVPSGGEVPKTFQPTWDSLEKYQTPAWFRDAKFGIWAHWGPQCEPEQGDWYARQMYFQGNADYQWQTEHFGHPSVAGFKDVIHAWKAEHWNPQQLVDLYKKTGARYFVALANHHDNFDLWDSQFQPWNSTRVGPEKNIIAGWAAAAKKANLRFGVSVHAAHAWSWYEPAQGADQTGPKKGVPYDGKLTKADGAGQWWDGLDPQDLYEQRHTPSPNFQQPNSIHARWSWGNGATVPDAAYCERFRARTMDLLTKYTPDLIYFDDSVLPLDPISDAGLRIAADFYNQNMAENHGKLEAVMLNKGLNEAQRKAMVWDIERGQSNRIEPLPWQADTCIGDWHYRRSLFEKHGYKDARFVIHKLADVVSKNGNLLLSIPVRADGTIDADEEAVLADIGAWFAINGEAIYGTRPWTTFGEGPTSLEKPALNTQGFNEGKTAPSTASDIRFTKKNTTVYALVLGKPTGAVKIKSLGTSSKFAPEDVVGVRQVGAKHPTKWSRGDDALTIEPDLETASDLATVFAITTHSKTVLESRPTGAHSSK